MKGEKHEENEKSDCDDCSSTLVFALTGCGGSDADKLVGTWSGEMDILEDLLPFEMTKED